MSEQSLFDRVFVISLSRRHQRLERFWRNFPSNWPWAKPIRWDAVDGSKAKIPNWFNAPPGAWGCYKTHIQLWLEQFVEQWDSMLVFEDDAILGRNAIQTIRKTMQVVPGDWDMVYFGGQHLRTNQQPPEVVLQDELIRGKFINRTHCYAIRRKFAEVALDKIDCPPKTKDGRLHHVDFRLCALHETGKYGIYAPWRFCVGQEAGESDIRGHRVKPRGQYVRQHWWNQFPIAEK